MSSQEWWSWEVEWHECGRCGARYRGRGAAIQCCGDRLEDGDDARDGRDEYGRPTDERPELEAARPYMTDGGREKCAECGSFLPDEIEPETGVYCPRCGTGQLIVDGGQPLPSVTVASDDERISALIDGGWYAYLATVDREEISPGDVDVLVSEVKRELDHILALECGERPSEEDSETAVRADGGR